MNLQYYMYMNIFINDMTAIQLSLFAFCFRQTIKYQLTRCNSIKQWDESPMNSNEKYLQNMEKTLLKVEKNQQFKKT